MGSFGIAIVVAVVLQSASPLCSIQTRRRRRRNSRPKPRVRDRSANTLWVSWTLRTG